MDAWIREVSLIHELTEEEWRLLLKQRKMVTNRIYSRNARFRKKKLEEDLTAQNKLLRQQIAKLEKENTHLRIQLEPDTEWDIFSL